MDTIFKSKIIVTRHWQLLSAVCLSAVLLVTAAFAAPGDLDPSFGSGGIVTTPPTAGMTTYFAYGVAIQSDGKIVAVGEGYPGSGPGTTWDFAVVRYNINGSLDTSFGGTGIVFTSVGDSHDGARSVAIQTDGKIVVAGYTNTDGRAVIRYNTNGSLDTSFGGTGIVTTSFGRADSVTIQADGRIVTAGGGNSGFALVRYNTDGSLDTSFGGTGMVVTRVGNSGSGARSVAIQADGKIVAAGKSDNDTGGSSFAVVRYTVFGQLDTSFNGTGIAITSFGNAFNGATSLVIQWDGKIVVAGNSDRYQNGDFAFVRYDPNGLLDTSFGGTGKVIIPVGNSHDFADSVAIQTDGKIVAAGGSFINADSEFALVRVNSNGSLDTTFNGTGKVITNTFSSAYSVAIQEDGKIVAAGGTSDEIFGFTLARYQGGPSPPNANGKIAFTSERDLNREIYVMNPDGTNQVRLTNNNIADEHPSWSPDGRKIAFISQRTTGEYAIFQMNADGTGKTEITPVNYLPSNGYSDGWTISWSPDGAQLVFTDKQGSAYIVSIVNADGTSRRLLTSGFGPAWSPDGSKILFITAGFSGRLHTIRPDGTDLRILPPLPNNYDIYYDATWSPTGGEIATTAFDTANEVIFITDADGTNARVFEFQCAESPLGCSRLAAPSWSPDGRTIAFPLLGFQSGLEIYVKDIAGGEARRLTNTEGQNRDPSWQPLPAISGIVTYGNAIGAPSPRFVSNVLISGAGSAPVSTTTNFTDGSYLLGGFGQGPYTVTPTKKDGQNSITSFDAAKIAQHAAGVQSLTGNQLIVADTSGNGTISSFDAAQVAGYAVGLPPFGNTGNWMFVPVNRTYSSISSSIAGENYSALLMGEVSGNWTNTGARPVGSGERKTGDWGRETGDEKGGLLDSDYSKERNDRGPERAVAVSVEHLVTAARSELVVPVTVQGANQRIISYEFDLRYDPSVIRPEAKPVDLVGTISNRLSFVTNAEEPGLLRVAVYGPIPLEGNGVLLNLRFTAVGAPGSVSPLTWEKFMFNEGLRMTVGDGQVELSSMEN